MLALDMRNVAALGDDRARADGVVGSFDTSLDDVDISGFSSNIVMPHKSHLKGKRLHLD